MKKIIIYGAGIRGRRYLKTIEEKYPVKVVAVCDGNEKKWGERVLGYEIISPKEAIKMEFDEVLVTPWELSDIEASKNYLIEMGVPEDRILLSALTSEYMDCDYNSRRFFSESMAKWVQVHNIPGAVAECGVYRGDNARFINRAFKDRTLYLFDTFEGFDARDLDREIKRNSRIFDESEFNSESKFIKTSESIVLESMPFPEKVIIKKGYFPESAEGVDDKFCYVNLDMDLYQPMINGLRFFWDKMSPGGVISLHDYFHFELGGVKEAVDEFLKEHPEAVTLPMGDRLSCLVVKGR